MTMLEKVAEALKEVYATYPDESDWKDSARAVIEAMREPTPEMLTALHPDERRKEKGERVSDFLDGWDAEDVWKAMIDTALDKP